MNALRSQAVMRNTECVIVGLFAELGSWIANVSSPIEMTSSVRGLYLHAQSISIGMYQSLYHDGGFTTVSVQGVILSDTS